MSGTSNANEQKKYQGYYDQGAEGRAREQKMFDYWNNELFKIGTKRKH